MSKEVSSGRRINRWAVFASLYLFAHAAVIILFRKHAEIASCPFVVGVPLLAAFVCVRAAWMSTRPARPGWIFAAIGLVVWAAGTALSTWLDETGSASPVLAGDPDFLYFFYGVALLLAITWSEEDAANGLFFWFDAIQATTAGFLAYIVIFNVLPFSGQAAKPIPASLLLTTYNYENASLVILSVLRLIGRTPSPGRRTFDTSMVLFTIPYGVAATVYNQYFMAESGLQDLLIDIPFLLMAAAATNTPRAPADQPHRTSFALLVDGAGPIFFTLTLLGFGAMVTRERVWLGTGAILLALVMYGLRAALLQSRYLAIQQELRTARDNLERLSMQDGLTGVSNRRSFDLGLREAWNSSRASGRPLSLLMIDVDHFKNLNDTLGHHAGDLCLTRIAETLLATLAGQDALVARYGGEEFAVLLREVGIDAALAAGEDLRMAVRGLSLPRKTILPAVTVSVGVATTEMARCASMTALLQEADRALYLAKQAGRDRVHATPAHDPPAFARMFVPTQEDHRALRPLGMG